MKPLQLKVKRLTPTAKLPIRGSVFSVGLDVFADNWVDLNGVQPGMLRVNTGITIEPPNSTYVLAVPRSSTCKHGLYLANSVGVIDPDYRGEVSLIFLYDPTSHLDIEEFLNERPRIAQLLVVPFIACSVSETNELTETERGTGGFGSTGVR